MLKENSLVLFYEGYTYFYEFRNILTAVIDLCMKSFDKLTVGVSSCIQSAGETCVLACVVNVLYWLLADGVNVLYWLLAGGVNMLYWLLAGGVIVVYCNW